MRGRALTRLSGTLLKARFKRRRHQSPSHAGLRASPDLGERRQMSRIIVEQLFSRVAGAFPIEGNSLRLLCDGEENYGAWLAAIAAARHCVHFENYIFRNDPIGRRFAEALAAKAKEGVAVRVLYDWMGCFGQVPRPLLASAQECRGRGPVLQSPASGQSVRVAEPATTARPSAWMARSDSSPGCAFAKVWVGDPSRKLPPWRDTGVELRGPAVADLYAAFAQSWAEAGGSVPADGGRVVPPAGDVSVRVIGSRPNSMGLYRFDQLIAGMARRSLWLTDAYFVGTTSYVRTLCDAAADGVDVRLLVPGASDIPVAKAMSRAGYRPLLEAGIRVYEWNGPMLHAKTAVADGRWARIGSSNLNIASWMGNWELDVAVEDEGFAAEMERMFERDLQGATEIMLDLGGVHSKHQKPGPARRGSPGRLAAGAVGLGSAVGAAITNHRALGPAESKVMAAGAGILLMLAAVAVAAPRLLTIPLAVLAVWIGVTLLIRAWRLRLSRTGPPDMLPTGNTHAATARPQAPVVVRDLASSGRLDGEDCKLEPVAPDRRHPG